MAHYSFLRVQLNSHQSLTLSPAIESKLAKLRSELLSQPNQHLEPLGYSELYQSQLRQAKLAIEEQLVPIAKQRAVQQSAIATQQFADLLLASLARPLELPGHSTIKLPARLLVFEFINCSEPLPTVEMLVQYFLIGSMLQLVLEPEFNQLARVESFEQVAQQLTEAASSTIQQESLMCQQLGLRLDQLEFVKQPFTTDLVYFRLALQLSNQVRPMEFKHFFANLGLRQQSLSTDLQFGPRLLLMASRQ